MTIKTFEYCSLHYLNMWLAHDMNYWQALADGNQNEKLTALKNAGGFYRVSRNLPLQYDEGKTRYAQVLEVINFLQPSDFGDTMEDTIETILKIAGEISKRYGNRNVLSLTTKFLPD